MDLFAWDNLLANVNPAKWLTASASCSLWLQPPPMPGQTGALAPGLKTALGGPLRRCLLRLEKLVHNALDNPCNGLYFVDQAG